MNKILLLFFILLTTVSAAQTCQNPGARVERLSAPSLTKDSIYQWIKNDLDFIQIKKHDTIADIGSYDGYYPSLYSIFADTVSFCLNDISQAGFAYFDSIQTACAKIKGSKLSNSFKIIIGDDSCANLPYQLFNKVVLRDALHHFKLMDKMLTDIKRILKPSADAKLILFEPIRGLTNIENLCRGAMTREELLKLMDRNGFILSKELPVKKAGIWFEFTLKEN